MKSKYTFSEKDFAEFEECENDKEFFFQALEIENGLFDLTHEEYLKEGIVFTTQFYKAYNASLKKKNRRLQVLNKVMKIQTKVIKIQTKALRSLTNFLLDSGLVICDEETEDLFQEREYEILIRSFK